MPGLPPWIWPPRAALVLPALVFAVMVGYLPGVLQPSTALRWALVAVVGTPAALGALALGRSGLAYLAALALAAWVAASLAWSASLWDTLGAGLRWLALGGVAAMAATQESRGPVWVAAALGVCASLPLAVAQAAGIHSWVADVNAVSTVPQSYTGAVGLFVVTNVMAEVGVAAGAGVLAARGWSLLALPPLACAVLSGRKEVALMLAAAALGAAPVIGRRRAAVLVLGLAVLSAAAVLAVYGGGAVAWSAAARIQIWVDALVNLKPLGWGLGTFEVLLPRYGHAHGEFIQAAFELGLGALPLYFLVIYALASPVSTYSALADRCALAALAAGALTWNTFQDPAPACLAAAALGGLLGDGARARGRAGRGWPLGGAGGLPRALRAGVVGSGAVRPAGSGDPVVAPRQACPVGGGVVQADVQRVPPRGDREEVAA